MRFFPFHSTSIKNKECIKATVKSAGNLKWNIRIIWHNTVPVVWTLMLTFLSAGWGMLYPQNATLGLWVENEIRKIEMRILNSYIHICFWKLNGICEVLASGRSITEDRRHLCEFYQTETVQQKNMTWLHISRVPLGSHRYFLFIQNCTRTSGPINIRLVSIRPSARGKKNAKQNMYLSLSTNAKMFDSLILGRVTYYVVLCWS
jgi:hypothetical protein